MYNNLFFTSSKTFLCHYYIYIFSNQIHHNDSGVCIIPSNRACWVMLLDLTHFNYSYAVYFELTETHIYCHLITYILILESQLVTNISFTKWLSRMRSYLLNFISLGNSIIHMLSILSQQRIHIFILKSQFVYKYKFRQVVFPNSFICY